MYKRTEKERNKEQNKKMTLFIWVLNLNIPELRRRTKNKLKKEAEDEIVYLGTRLQHPRDRFRKRVKNKNDTNNKTGKKFI